MGWWLPSLSNLLDSRCQVLHLSLPRNAVGITGISRAAYRITSKCLPLFICSLLHKLSLSILVFFCSVCLYFLFSLPSITLLPGKYRWKLHGIAARQCTKFNLQSYLTEFLGLGGVPQEKEISWKNWTNVYFPTIKPPKIQLMFSLLNCQCMLWH